MKLTQWTLFIDMLVIDMLGYRDINGSINNEKKAKEFISFMELNKKIFDITDNEGIRESYKENKEFNLYEYYEIQSAFISDSLIITYYPKEVNKLNNVELANMHSANALFIILMRLSTFLFHCFKEKGLFLRGGVSNKYCYIKGNFAVGEGLIEAYLAESKLAKNPRIVLHPEVQKCIPIMEKINFISNEMYSGKSIIQKDKNDGLYFLDYVGYVISTSNISIPMIYNSAISNIEIFEINAKMTSNYLISHAKAIKKNYINYMIL